MTLKPPKPQLPVSESANQLQREAASRVTQRYEEQCRKEKRREMRARIRSWLSILFLLGLCGGGYYVWWSGSLKDWEQWAKSITGPLLGADDRTEDPLTALERKFREAKVDYWQNAPAKDRPEKGGPPLTFWCLAVDENNSPVFLELKMAADANIQVQRLSADAGLVKASHADFTKLIAKNPYLVMREGRAYFAAKGKSSLPALCAIPNAKTPLDPARLEFGGLYAVFKKMSMPPPPFRYDVFFETEDKSPLLIATVGFGETVPRTAFIPKVAALYGLKTTRTREVESVMGLGRVKVSRHLVSEGR